MQGTTFSETVRFRAPVTFVSAVREAAAAEGVKVSEWLRRAGRDRLETQNDDVADA